MTPLIEHSGVEGVRPRVVVDGRRRGLRPGDQVEVTDEAAREYLAAGSVRLVNGKGRKAEPGPTGGESGDGKGEAGSTEAAVPPPSPAAALDDALTADDVKADTDEGTQAEKLPVIPFDGETTDLDKTGLCAELEKRNVKHDKRWNQARLKAALDDALTA